MALTFADTHYMIAFLTKSDASEGFNQIIDFLNASSIKYALTVNPNIYVSIIKQFWSSVTVKKVNDVSRLQALVDRKKVIIKGATIRDALRLDDAEGIECLPNEEIFTGLARMGYEKPSTKLNFIRRFSHKVGEGAAKVNVEDVSTAGVAAEGAASDADDEVSTANDLSIPSPPPPTQLPPPSQDNLQLPNYGNNKVKTEVKKLERRNKLKASKLRRLKKVGTTQKVETSNDTVMDDVSKQGRILVDIDVDKDVNLKDVAAVAKDVKDAEIKESIDAARRGKGVVIRDPEESATLSTIIHTEAKSKDKGKRILAEEPKPLKKQAQIKQDEAYARELEAKLNKNIDRDEVIDHVQRKEKEDNTVKRYQAMKREPQTEAQARKNMMIYLRNVAGFKMDYFKGMTYDDICPIFEKKFNSNKKLDEEVSELKRHLQIVPNYVDDVYTEATPLARKVPVLDYEIYTENNKPYYKIIRADGSPQLFLSFLSLLRNFDREDLEVLWELVKESFGVDAAKEFKENLLSD
uniref:Xylulose kinase-1 n=1 Tax=Tanacetum cinerariifolium TaxID=118510 RepID=A0A6L2P3C2_TANCI|nr:hypothetical protein [Tanacetum cinerariifolium]